MIRLGEGMTRVAIVGIGGRMCGRIGHLVHEAEDQDLTGGVEYSGSDAVGRDLGEVIGISKTGHHVVDSLEMIIGATDVVVAFTAPAEPTVAAAEIAGAAGKPLIIGTTGLSAEQIKRMTEALKDVPCVFAANFSIGVTALTKLVEDAARILGNEYDVEVVETHHRFKKDAPSGTALLLAESAARGLERDLNKVGVYGRHGDVGERTQQEIGIHALRAGDIVGEHTVTFGGIGETVQIVHRAQSRDTFAVGVVRAIRFAVEADAGIYNMRDVLGIS
jgi:4-hydroxy-tetrahydrodipicolinate reductase